MGPEERLANRLGTNQTAAKLPTATRRQANTTPNPEPLLRGTGFERRATGMSSRVLRRMVTGRPSGFMQCCFNRKGGRQTPVPLLESRV